MTPVLLAFVAGMLAGAGIITGYWYWVDANPTPPDDPADVWPRPYGSCDRCVALRFRGTPESMGIHQDVVHGRVLTW